MLPPGLYPGALLASRYHIQSAVGAGGMGWVFKAHDRFLDVVVALKVLRPEVSADPSKAHRFRSEVKLARRVRHPNVCSVHEYGEDGGLSYLAMEFVTGCDLKRLLRQKGGPLGWDEGWEVGIQTARGLQAVHDQGIVHRDVKTPNITRDAGGVVRLMDFGIARDWGADGGITASGRILGTPEYMSPEQVRGLTLDGRSDLYSLGVVLYEVFTGRLPFAGESPMDVLLRQLQDQPVLTGPAAARLPAPLVSVLHRALAKSSDDRYATGQEMAEALVCARAATGPEPPRAGSRQDGSWPTDEIPELLVPRLARQARLDPRTVLPSLIDALTRADLASRASAAQAIGRLGEDARDAVPALVRALRDRAGSVRAHAAHALRSIGPEAAGAVLQLLETMNDERRFVRDAASSAVARLTVPSPARRAGAGPWTRQSLS
jgi:serine/threonine protein kinase